MSRINAREPRHGDQVDKAAAFVIGFACALGVLGHMAGLW